MRKFWDNAAEVRGQTGQCGAGALAREPLVPPDRQSQALKPVPASLSIGSVTIRPATVLAPMAGVTDTVFRRFIRNLGGCGLIMTEFTSADGVLRAKDKKAKRYLHFYEDEHPISAQLFGSDPRVMAEAARMVEGLGFDLVDLNLGCPAKKVVKCNGGSGLLRDLPAIGKIFEAVRAAVKIPFTVKFRAGWNDEEIVCVELARMAESCGLCAVALHARTREQGYSGQARWEWIAAVKDGVKIPVIGNGDIRTPEDACAMVTQTGCDAVMIGRTAPSNPWIFRQIEQYCAGMREAESVDDHVGTAASPVQIERSSTSLNGDDGSGVSSIREGHDRQGHDFSHADEHKKNQAALPAESGFFRDGSEPSGAKALDIHGQLGGTAEAVPFPSVPRSKLSLEAKLYDQPTESDRYQMIRTYFQMLIEEELPDAAGKMKQFASWFTYGVPGGAGLRKAIYGSKNAAEILGRVEEFFEARLCGAGAHSVGSAMRGMVKGKIYHESGHAVVAKNLGFEVTEIRISAPESGVTYDAPARPSPEDVKKMCVVAAGGAAAEIIIYGDYIPNCCADDSAKISELGGGQLSDYLPEAQEEIRANRPLFDRIARELKRRKEDCLASGDPNADVVMSATDFASLL